MTSITIEYVDHHKKKFFKTLELKGDVAHKLITLWNTVKAEKGIIMKYRVLDYFSVNIKGNQNTNQRLDNTALGEGSFMIDGEHIYNFSGRVTSPSAKDLSELIRQLWKEAQEDAK